MRKYDYNRLTCGIFYRGELEATCSTPLLAKRITRLLNEEDKRTAGNWLTKAEIAKLKRRNDRFMRTAKILLGKISKAHKAGASKTEMDKLRREYQDSLSRTDLGYTKRTEK